MRGPLPECAGRGVASRRRRGAGSWGLGVGRAGSGGETRSPRERKEALQRRARARESVPEREAGGGCSPRRRQEVSAEGSGRPGRPPPSRCGVAGSRSAPSGGEPGREGGLGDAFFSGNAERLQRRVGAGEGRAAREVPGVCVKVKRDAGAAGGRDAGLRGAAARRAGRARVSAGGGGRGAPRADGKELAGGAPGPSRPGRGGGGEPGAGPRRRRAGLAPDLTFWVRACVPEARWGRGWGREAVREVPGWLSSAPFSLPPLPAPEGTGPQGPGGSGRGPQAGGRRSLPEDPRLSGPGAAEVGGAGWSLRAGAPCPGPSGESRQRPR